MGNPVQYPGGIVAGKFPETGQIVRIPIGKKGMACHTAAFGASGSGKTWSFVYPNIVSAVADGSSIVVSDPKGELVAGKFNRQGQYEPGIAGWLVDMGYKVRVLNLMNPEDGTHRFNLLMEPRNDDEFLALCTALIESVENGRPDQVFFKAGEIAVLSSFVGLTRYNSWFRDEQRHMRTALSVLNWNVDDIDLAFERERSYGNIPEVFYERWVGSKSNFDNFKAGISGKLATLTRSTMALATSSNDIDLEGICKEKTALFLIFPTMGDIRPILTGFYFLLFKRLVEFAAKCRGSLPVPVRFIMDEFANIGKIPDFSQRVSFDRGLGITYVIIMQALSQLYEVYGKGVGDAILNSCDIQLCLRANDNNTAKYFTDAFGEAKVKKISMSKDITTPFKQMLTKKVESIEKVPLMEPWQLRQLPFYTAVATIPASRPVYLATVPFSDLREFSQISKDVKKISDYAPVPNPDIPLPELNGIRNETIEKQIAAVEDSSSEDIDEDPVVTI